MRTLIIVIALAASIDAATGYDLKDQPTGEVQDAAVLTKALTTIADGFGDPDAVQFRHIRTGNGAICGELNAKNAFGAYVGFQPFFQMDFASSAPGGFGLGQSSPVCNQ